MAIYSKNSLEELRQKVDLVDVIAPYVNLKRTGASYKGLCPFHNEKSPSFHIQKGDTHYHCFGCGAHGDAIGFLMNYLKLSFSESVEMLAEKFAVTLEKSEALSLEKGPDLASMKKVLNQVSGFYHFHLLHTDEGHKAIHYLYQRGITLDFIKAFKVGFSPQNEALSLAFFKEMGVSQEIIAETGLLQAQKTGKSRPFFGNRIMFPIQDVSDNVIGFSARKIDEATFGGKYINTPETPLFKKSKVLFGLNHSRKRIAKERKVIVVEGQIDALRLIHEGINITVASQGTAFGKDHVSILHKLGVNQVYLAFDGDEAGKEAALKVGQLFQIDGIGVSVLQFKKGDDPDLVLRKEGSSGFLRYLEESVDYITFLVSHLKCRMPNDTPAGKNELTKKVLSYIEAWEHPVMVHEGLKDAAKLLDVPETLIDVEPKAFVEKEKKESFDLDPHRILETDLIRWLLIGENKELFALVEANLSETDFFDPPSRKLFNHIRELFLKGAAIDLLDLASSLDQDEEDLLSVIHQKRINSNRAKEGVILVIQKMLERRWMCKREEIKNQIQSQKYSEEEVLNLAKEFDRIKREVPQVVLT